MTTKLQTHLISNNLEVCSRCEHESVITDGKPICGLTGEETLFLQVFEPDTLTRVRQELV